MKIPKKLFQTRAIGEKTKIWIMIRQAALGKSRKETKLLKLFDFKRWTFCGGQPNRVLELVSR